MDSTVWRTDDSVRRVPAHRFISAEAIASSAFEGTHCSQRRMVPLGESSVKNLLDREPRQWGP